MKEEWGIYNTKTKDVQWFTNRDAAINIFLVNTSHTSRSAIRRKLMDECDTGSKTHRGVFKYDFLYYGTTEDNPSCFVKSSEAYSKETILSILSNIPEKNLRTAKIKKKYYVVDLETRTISKDAATRSELKDILGMTVTRIGVAILHRQVFGAGRYYATESLDEAVRFLAKAPKERKTGYRTIEEVVIFSLESGTPVIIERLATMQEFNKKYSRISTGIIGSNIPFLKKVPHRPDLAFRVIFDDTDIKLKRDPSSTQII